MNVKTNKSGFTLTEILIVLVIAGILLALILPNSLKAVEKGNQTAGKSNVQSCKTAVLMCYAANDGKSWTLPNDCTDINNLLPGKLNFLKEVGKNDKGDPITVVADSSTTPPSYTCQ